MVEQNSVAFDHREISEVLLGTCAVFKERLYALEFRGSHMYDTLPDHYKDLTFKYAAVHTSHGQVEIPGVELGT